MKIDPTGLAWRDIYRLIIGSVVPRPIALVSTVDANGCSNAAPFSFFMPASITPPMICFSAGPREGQKKHTIKNIELNGDFVVNITDEELAREVAIAAADFPEGISEFTAAGLHELPSDKVRSPRVAEAPINFECRSVKFVDLPGSPTTMIVGEIVKFHIADHLYEDGRINVIKLGAIGHLAGDLYCRSTDTFKRKRHVYGEEIPARE